jgi:hypothetical protein
VNNILGDKENDDHALDFALHLSRFFSVSVNLHFPCTAHAVFLERLSNQCMGLRRTFSEICTKCDAVPLSDSSRNRIRQGKQLQIKKNEKTPWSESASELYRPSDRRLSAK